MIDPGWLMCALGGVMMVGRKQAKARGERMTTQRFWGPPGLKMRACVFVRVCACIRETENKVQSCFQMAKGKEDKGQ